MSEKKQSRAARILVRLGLVIAGLVVGVGIAEAAFWARDEGAFPHANFYVADEALGVRLEPGATSRVKLRTNPATDVRINSLGYRGGELGAPAPNEIIVVGDSQAFGLGVEETETFAAKLGELTQRPVVNAGVPTYGPLEYNAVVRELLASRHAKTVVYLVNFSNDLFETDRPNVDRHVAWDGWAVRAETAPPDYLDFPLRRLLFQRSHLVYALRRYLYEQGDRIDSEGFASEGTFTDLVALGGGASEAHAREEQEVRLRAHGQRDQLTRTKIALGEAENAIEAASNNVAELQQDDWLRLQAARGNPGDILSADAEESTRPVAVTARLIRQGVELRNRLLSKARNEAVQRAVAQRDDLVTQRRELEQRALFLEEAFVPSVLEPRIREVKELCDQAGAELIVVALPIDVQVSPSEWDKYGTTPVDMSATRVLLGDLVATSERLGARGVDVSAALEAAEPGAFLDHDIHMTPKGHEAVARAIAARLAQPAPLARPSIELPPGRSRVPEPDEWYAVTEATVRGSSRAQCETVIVREWLMVTCVKSRTAQPSGVSVLAGGHGEVMTVSTEDATTLVAPLLEGDELRADFFWANRAQTLVARWPNGAAREIAFEEPRADEGRAFSPDANDERLCRCYEEIVRERTCENYEGDYYEIASVDTSTCQLSCTHLYGEARPECFTAYAQDCAGLVACARGSVIAPPRCEVGSANVLATLQCAPLCSSAQPCASGTCSPWGGSSVCL